jgi:hypothetical protein
MSDIVCPVLMPPAKPIGLAQWKGQDESNRRLHWVALSIGVTAWSLQLRVSSDYRWMLCCVSCHLLPVALICIVCFVLCSASATLVLWWTQRQDSSASLLSWGDSGTPNPNFPRCLPITQPRRRLRPPAGKPTTSRTAAARRSPSVAFVSAAGAPVLGG